MTDETSRAKPASDEDREAGESHARQEPGSRAALAMLAGAVRADIGRLARIVSLRARQAWRRARQSEGRGATGPASDEAAAAPASSIWQRLRRRGAVKWALGAATVMAVLVAGTLVWALRDVPWDEIAEGALEPVVVLETAEGTPLVQQGAYRAGYASYDDFPQHLVDAVTAIEDRRFFEHGGLDLRGILRAALRNFSAGAVVEGGSTITQQLIKISYLDRDRTFRRKIQEAVIALWLDGRLSKEDILARYLNAIYLGAGATGVPAAAQVYFSKPVGELTLAESAMIAGLIRAPSALNPLSNPDAAEERTRVVLDAMVDAGRIDESQAGDAKSEYAELKPARPVERSGSWFADWAMGDAREIAGAFKGTVRVATTIEPHYQRAAETAIREALDAHGEEFGASQAALVAMTPDGAVVAMVGGRDYGESSFNRAVQAKRQPGSTFKLFVYYAAMKAGIPMNALVDDSPVEIDGWSPENSGGRYFGRVTLAEAFARSLNASTVKLAMEVGIDRVIEAAHELGIDAELQNSPALSLGTTETSLLDMTGAYASVLAGKAPVEGWGIASVAIDGGDATFSVGPDVTPAVDLSPYQGDLVGLLQLALERGTGRQASFGAFAGGKTGTSQDYRDAWFIGFTEPLAAGVWVGNDDNSPMKGVTGGKLPALIWKNFMEAAMAPPEPSAEPSLAGSREAVQPAQSCNFRACARAYRSFRPEDCTFQPYDGPRKLCEK